MRSSEYNLNAFRSAFCLLVCFGYWFAYQGLHSPALDVLEVASDQLLYGLPNSIYAFFNMKVVGIKVVQLWCGSVSLLLLAAAVSKNGRTPAIAATALYLVVEGLIAAHTRTSSSVAPAFALLVLCFTPKAFSHSLSELIHRPTENKQSDQEPAILAISLILPLVYGNAFVSKILNGRWSWLNGESMQAYFLYSHLQRQNELAEWLYQSPMLCLVLGALTMLFEGGFWAVLFFRRFRPAILAFGIFFHLSVYLSMGLNFLWSYLPLYLIYLDFARITTFAKRGRAVMAFALFFALFAAYLITASGGLLRKSSARVIEDFTLFDLDGRPFSLRASLPIHTKFVVVFSQGNGCPIARRSIGTLETLKKSFEGQGVFFVMINANPQDSVAEIRAEARHMGVSVPILRDETQATIGALGFERTAHAIVIRTEGWTLEYSGAVDEGLDYAGSRPGGARNFLEEALLAMLAGKPAPLTETPVKGCLIGKRS